MGTEMTLEEVERRIRIVEDNLRELMEQAAAFSGAADEERAAARIADQQEKLDALLKQRAELTGEG
ncbi:MAG: hypothetical protein KDJ72_12405 [Methyloceanibacter sp.]|uniref:hypothetical protein n=1 Tax=Methyloceanibacter sp. TaxID=1965321 RepID=UPI001D72984B|nr:hypothetical protein [Methyloceanibacter sp.]MCB1443813.1 hypothetical protein [Methyloceanibacter sp.]MCC0058207.1 hypothetical protein [Hyphomicrobiaceae bacterium]